MNWKSNRTQKRRAGEVWCERRFAWYPQLGLDGRWHWLESCERGYWRALSGIVYDITVDYLDTTDWQERLRAGTFSR